MRAYENWEAQRSSATPVEQEQGWNGIPLIVAKYLMRNITLEIVNKIVYYLTHEKQGIQTLAGPSGRDVPARQRFALEGVSKRQTIDASYAQQ